MHKLKVSEIIKWLRLFNMQDKHNHKKGFIWVYIYYIIIDAIIKYFKQ